MVAAARYDQQCLPLQPARRTISGRKRHWVGSAHVDGSSAGTYACSCREIARQLVPRLAVLLTHAWINAVPARVSSGAGSVSDGPWGTVTCLPSIVSVMSALLAAVAENALNGLADEARAFLIATERSMLLFARIIESLNPLNPHQTPTNPRTLVTGGVIGFIKKGLPTMAACIRLRRLVFYQAQADDRARRSGFGSLARVRSVCSLRLDKVRLDLLGARDLRRRQSVPAATATLTSFVRCRHSR